MTEDTIIESRNVIFFKDTFRCLDKVYPSYSKRPLEGEDEEAGGSFTQESEELRHSKRAKTVKMFDPDFIT